MTCLTRDTGLPYVKMFILGETDTMLSCGVKAQIHDIFQKLISNTLGVLLGATMPSDGLEVTKHFTRTAFRFLSRWKN